MIQNYNEENKERAFLISLDCGEYDAESSMAELEELAKTSGAEIIGEMIQKRPAPEAATYMGKGALEEICNFCSNHNIDLIIADGELSPVQIRNIEDLTGVRVIDRTTLILDIFAGRARSSEGKLQVELAQLKYSLPRLSGKGTALSRLGGGIGTRARAKQNSKPTGGISVSEYKTLRRSLTRLKSAVLQCTKGARKTVHFALQLSVTQMQANQRS